MSQPVSRLYDGPPDVLQKLLLSPSLFSLSGVRAVWRENPCSATCARPRSRVSELARTRAHTGRLRHFNTAATAATTARGGALHEPQPGDARARALSLGCARLRARARLLVLALALALALAPLPAARAHWRARRGRAEGLPGVGVGYADAAVGAGVREGALERGAVGAALGPTCLRPQGA